MSDAHDDLEPERTEGFKVGQKKTIDEYQQLGQSSRLYNSNAAKDKATMHIIPAHPRIS